ncbi:hypothetical protein SEUCBS140593_000890 [Sporothrix eucalyptigena]|uniref:Uncharacterized protein n=1 Tax=Sporothrix eucalyptigena TaxID=1812306 RepID=A0ABP0ATL6_9PEZI
MVYAAEMGRVRIFEALLGYRDSLTPAPHDPAKEAYEWLERVEGNSVGRLWDTPLTTACMCGRVDVDINACDKFGYTPLQAVARHAQRTVPSANGHGVDPAQAAAVAEESKRRVAVVRLLPAHGA